MKKISIYSTPSCTYCKIAKDFFRTNKVKFEEYNVASDLEKRQEMMEKSEQMGVPVIIVGNEVVVGFDQEKISNLLGIKVEKEKIIPAKKIKKAKK